MIDVQAGNMGKSPKPISQKVKSCPLTLNVDALSKLRDSELWGGEFNFLIFVVIEKKLILGYIFFRYFLVFNIYTRGSLSVIWWQIRKVFSFNSPSATQYIWSQDGKSSTLNIFWVILFIHGDWEDLSSISIEVCFFECCNCCRPSPYPVH